MGFEVEKTLTTVPLFILADCSTSMKGEKISSCNQAIKDMISELKSDETTKDSVDITLITFNSSAQLVNQTVQISDFNFQDLSADGSTAMGHAFNIVNQEINNYLNDAKSKEKKITAPHIICFTDGYPTDVWQNELDNLIQAHPHAVRIALAIEFGRDTADRNMLKKFVSKDKEKAKELLFTAQDVISIKDFFRYTTRLTKASTQGIAPPTPQNNTIMEP